MRNENYAYPGYADADDNVWAIDRGRQPTPRQASPIRLLIVERQPIFQQGLRVILDSQPDIIVIGKATTAAEAIAEFRRLRPDVSLLNERLRDDSGTGIDVLTAIRSEFPKARIIMLATADGDAEIQRALRAGAASYVLKNAGETELLEIIRSVHLGRKRIPQEVAVRLAEYLGNEDLTPREFDVLDLMRDGHGNKQIADLLSIAQTTVNFHIQNLVGKLHANGRTHAVVIAIRRGLLHA
jgi:DNA-binding NarL/FixJ family response regulator